MPGIGKHVEISRQRTGKDYLELHEWIDKDPEKKVERHDITKICEYGKMFEEILKAYPAFNKGDKPLARHLKYHEEIRGLMKGKA